MKNTFINLEVYNNEKIDNDNDPLLQLSSTNAQAILENPEEYEFSIIRFMINSPLSFPLFMPDIQLNQPNPNLMTCSASLVFKAKRLNGSKVFTVKHTKQFVYIPQVQNQSVTAPTATDVDYSSSQYYWVSTYQHIEHIMNYNLSRLHQETRSLLDMAIANDWSTEGSLGLIEVDTLHDDLPLIGFNGTSYTSASSSRPGTDNGPERAFNKIYGAIGNVDDGLYSRGWHVLNTSNSVTNTDRLGPIGREWIQIDLVKKYNIGSFEIYSVSPSYNKIYIVGANDVNDPWTIIYRTDSLIFSTQVGAIGNTGYFAEKTNKIDIYNIHFFRYYRLIIDGPQSLANISVQELLLYGIEEAITTSYPAAPQLSYNNDSQKFSLYLDKSAFGLTYMPSDSGISNLTFQGELYFDSNLQGMLFNFPNIKEGNDVKNVQNKEKFNYRIVVPPNHLNLPDKSYRDIVNSIDYHVIQQENPSLSSFFSPIKSILFTSNLIPIEPELSPAPLIYTDGKQVSQTTRTISERVLTDFELPIGAADQWRQTIYYQPHVYRWSSMSSSGQAIRTLDLRAYMKLRFSGELVPLRLYNGSSVSVKLAFRRMGTSDLIYN